MRLLLGGVALLLGCSGSPSSSPDMVAKKSLNISVEKLALPYCPICEMRFSHYPVADTLTYDGKLYGFCSEGCKEAFIKRMGSS
ncbi:MAG: hypothetical protein N2253_00935 [Bacteroidia bacterium]|nr:hypothetical protein [Bacteroidia bacterium]MCX7763442.1 hypothetical protein [Bacteroidia bacterium]MDW8056989.1 YHS domain-containing protein [Bacteroidia bacterium]